MLQIASLAAYAVYFSVIIVLGFIAYRRNQQTGDYILGGRKLSYWVTALAAQASDMSAWLFMVFPAGVYTMGLLGGWTAVGCVLFMMLNWVLIAPKLRTMTEFHGSATLSSFFEKRFNDTSGALRIISGICALMFLMFYIAGTLAALGHLFEIIFHLNYFYGICAGSLVVFYILLGGYTSVAWIDCFQGMLLMCAIVAVPIAAWHALGTTAISNALQAHGAFNFIPTSWDGLGASLMVLIGWGPGYFGQPQIITKFMGIDNAKNITKARYVGLAWQTITLVAAACVGLVGLAYFPQALSNPEHVFIALTHDLFNPFLAGLILCAIIAASINAIGGQVLACASVITEDFVKRVSHTRTALIPLISRLAVIAVCGIALITAYLNEHTTITQQIFYAWSGLGCSFGPLVLVALHTRMKSRYAAILGVVVGALVGICWQPIFGGSQAATLLIGFCASMSAMFVGNLFFRKQV